MNRTIGQKEFIVKHINALADFSPIKTPTGNKLIELVGLANGHFDKNLSFAHIRIPPHSEDPYHYHPTLTELYYILEGSCHIDLDGEKSKIKPGDCIHIPPLVKHKLINDSDEELVLLAICSPAWTEKGEVPVPE